MRTEHIIPYSEVIRAIVPEDSPCRGGARTKQSGEPAVPNSPSSSKSAPCTAWDQYPQVIRAITIDGSP